MKTKLISATLGVLLLTGSAMAMADRDDKRRGDFRGRDRGADVRGHDTRVQNHRGDRDFGNYHNARRGHGQHREFRHHPRHHGHGHWQAQRHHGRHSYYDRGYAPHHYQHRNRDGGLTIILRGVIR